MDGSLAGDNVWESSQACDVVVAPLYCGSLRQQHSEICLDEYSPRASDPTSTPTRQQLCDDGFDELPGDSLSLPASPVAVHSSRAAALGAPETPPPARWAKASALAQAASTPASDIYSSSPASALYCRYQEELAMLQQQDEVVAREERERELQLQDLERQRWLRALEGLETEVFSRRRMLQNAEELARERAESVEAAAERHEQEQPSSVRELQAQEAFREQDSVKNEVAEWTAEARRLKQHVDHISACAGQELIRAERLRGCALARQACCMDLERLVGSRRGHAQHLAEQIRVLTSELSARKSEAAQEREQWLVRRRELEDKLEEARRKGDCAKESFFFQSEERNRKHEARMRQLSNEFDRKAAHLETVAAEANDRRLTLEQAEQSEAAAALSAESVGVPEVAPVTPPLRPVVDLLASSPRRTSSLHGLDTFRSEVSSTQGEVVTLEDHSGLNTSLVSAASPGPPEGRQSQQRLSDLTGMDAYREALDRQALQDRQRGDDEPPEALRAARATPGTPRASLGGSAPSGAKVAALRASLRRQEQENKRELQEIQKEVAQERERLSSEAYTHARQSRDLAFRLSQAREEVSGTEESIQRHRVFREEQEAVIADLEIRLEARPRLLKDRVRLLEHGAAVDAESPRQHPMLSRALHDRLLRLHLTDEDLGEGDPKELLSSICADMRSMQQQELQQIKDDGQSEVERLVTEVYEERATEAEHRERAIAYEQERHHADMHDAEELQEMARNIRRVHEATQAKETAVRQAVLRRAQMEADEAETAYRKLRQALLTERAQAERDHAEFVEEQAAQRRRLVAELSDADVSGLDGLDDLSELLAEDNPRSPNPIRPAAKSPARSFEGSSRATSKGGPAFGRCSPSKPYRTP